MRVNSKNIIKVLDEIAPQKYAEDWDNVGFQVGNISKTVGKVMVCLEVTDAIIEEAIDKNVDLIITHHPLIFAPLKALTNTDPVQNRIRILIQNDINLYAAHTNLDSTKGGLNDYLAKIIGVENVEALISDKSEDDYGLGRIGYLSERLPLSELIEVVKKKLNLKFVKFTGDLERKVNKIAFCTGAGASLINDAIKNGCDVLITGDVKYHEALVAEDHRLAVIDAGHFETENIYCKELKRILDLKFEERDYDVQVIEAEKVNSPLKFI